MTDATDASRPPESPLTREEYFDERDKLIQARQRAYQRADQMVVGGATGALLLSVTFLERIAKGPGVVRPGLLVAAWVALLVCLSTSLLGQYATARSFDCELAGLDARVQCKPIPANVWAKLNQACALSGAALLVAGIALLARFAYLNAPFN